MGVCLSKVSARSALPVSSNFRSTLHQQDIPETQPNVPSSSINKQTELICQKVASKICSTVFQRSELSSLLSEWKESGVLSSIDAHALAVSTMIVGSLEELTSALQAFERHQAFSDKFHLQLATAYALYRWITFNIVYDKQQWLEHGSAEPEQVLKTRKATSHGFARLFEKLAGQVMLTAVTIDGHERGGRILNRSSASTRFTINKENAHAWNAVEINNVWILLDCSYGARSVAHGWQAVDCLSPYYFAVPPEHMIFTHWPQEGRWQQLNRPLDFTDVQALVAPHAGVFALGVRPLTCAEQVELTADMEDPVLSVELQVPITLRVTACLVELKKGGAYKQGTAEPAASDQAVFLSREDDGDKVRVLALCTTPGAYSLNIYVQQRPSEPMIFCFSYYILNSIVGHEYYGFPVVYDVAAAAFKFQLISWNLPQKVYISKNDSGKMNIKFKLLPGVKLNHCVMPGKVGAPVPSKELHYYTSVHRDAKDSRYHSMDVLFCNEGWWSVFILCSMTSEEQDCSSSYTLVARILMYASCGVKRQTFPYITSPLIIFDSVDPISAPDGEVLKLPFKYNSDREETLEAYIAPDNYPTKLYSGCAKVQQNASGAYVLLAILPLPGTWSVCIVSTNTHSQSKQTVVCQLQVEVNHNMTNTVFPYLFEAVASELGIELASPDPVMYKDDGNPFKFTFSAPEGIEFIHFIKPMTNTTVAVQKETNSNSENDFCTLLIPPTDNSRIYTLHSLFPYSGKWSVNIFARCGSMETFTQVVCLSELEVSNPHKNLCYPKLNPSQQSIAFPSHCLPCISLVEKPEFQLPFSAIDCLYFSLLMKHEVSTDTTYNHAYVHKVLNKKHNYRLHVVFPKSGTWHIQVIGVVEYEGRLEPQLMFEIRLNAIEYTADVVFPEVSEDFHKTFRMKLVDAELPLLRRIRKIPSTIVIPFYKPDNVLLWHLAKSNNVVNEAATQVVEIAEQGKHELTAYFNVSGRWVITLYAQHASSFNKADWITVLQHTVIVGHSLSTST